MAESKQTSFQVQLWAQDEALVRPEASRRKRLRSMTQRFLDVKVDSRS